MTTAEDVSLRTNSSAVKTCSITLGWGGQQCQPAVCPQPGAWGRGSYTGHWLQPVVTVAAFPEDLAEYHCLSLLAPLGKRDYIFTVP